MHYEACNSAYRGGSAAVLECAAYRKGYKEKVLKGYQHILGNRRVDMLYIDGAGSRHIPRFSVENI